MKKTTMVLSLTVLMATMLMAGNDDYYQRMAKTLEGFASCETPGDYQELANSFHIIAQVEKDEWLPRYYEAYCYILMSFRNNMPAEKRDNYLEQARPLVEEVMDMVPDNPEALTLQAFWYTGKLVVDPPSRSMEVQPLIAQSLGKALSIEPGHPRALFMRISNDMGTAAFFGKDTTPYCKEAAELLAGWDSYQTASPIHPSWGKEDVAGIVKRCGQ